MTENDRGRVKTRFPSVFWVPKARAGRKQIEYSAFYEVVFAATSFRPEFSHTALLALEVSGKAEVLGRADAHDHRIALQRLIAAVDAVLRHARLCLRLFERVDDGIAVGVSEV
jgi:hypothetical protein